VVQRRFLDGRPLERRFEFDANGNRTKAVDETGREMRFEYDELNRLVATTQPSPDGVAPNPVTRREFDASGNLTRYVNANGSAWTYVHDALGRVVRETDPLGHATTYEHECARQAQPGGMEVRHS
jgi:YD repeat-containing protein